MSPLPAEGASFGSHEASPFGLVGQAGMNEKLCAEGAAAHIPVPDSSASAPPIFVFGAAEVPAAAPPVVSPVQEGIFVFGVQSPAAAPPPPFPIEPTVFQFGVPPSDTSASATANGFVAFSSAVPDPGAALESQRCSEPSSLFAVPSVSSRRGGHRNKPRAAAVSGTVRPAANPLIHDCPNGASPNGAFTSTHGVGPHLSALGVNSVFSSGEAAHCHQSANADGIGARSPTNANPSPLLLTAPKLDWTAEVKLGEAKVCAEQQRFFEAVEACMPVLSGPDRAITVLRGVCESWKKCHESTFSEQQDEIRSVTAQFMAARDRADTLRSQKERKDVELRIERERREEAEKQATWLRRRSQLYEEAQRENSRLKQEVREARRPPPSLPKEELARQMAALECGPLLRCTSAERVAFKKKLLLKWHPDKQPSQHHAVLATQVMQELQNRPEWDY